MKRIAFVFPYNTWGGAFRSTFSLGDNLIKRGLEVDVIFPIIPPRNGYKILSFKWIYEKFKGILRSLIRRDSIKVNSDVNVILVPWISAIWIKKYDYIIANHWNTVEDIYRLPQSCGKKIHYIRDIEQWSFYFSQEIKAFRLPIKKIVVAKWISEYLKTNFKINADIVITNGTELSRFKLLHKKPSLEKINIGMCCSEHPMKGINYGIEAMRLLSLQNNNFKFILFGYKKPKIPMNFDYEWVQAPTGELLREVYRRIHIFISPSLQEGYHNPPREAMCAKCAVIATDVGCIPDLGIDNFNLLKVSIKNSEEIVNSIMKLSQNPDFMKKLTNNAYEMIKKEKWEKIAIRFEKFIAKIN